MSNIGNIGKVNPTVASLLYLTAYVELMMLVGISVVLSHNGHVLYRVVHK